MTELIAKLPFVKGTKASQSLDASFNDKNFSFTLRWNVQNFFTLNVAIGEKVYLNQKLTDVAIMGKDPDTHILEFLILPYDVGVDTLDLRIMTWDSVI